jgi:type I restriction enzyme S subunit
MTAVRLKDIVAINQRALPDSSASDFAFRYIDISCVNPDGKISLPDNKVTFDAAPSRARRLAAPGDVIVSTVRTYLRAIARVPTVEDPVVFSTGFAVLTPTARVDSGYLFYLCRSEPFVQEVVARSVGVSYPAINASELGDFHVDLPQLPQQRAIAAALDAETAMLDEMRDQLLGLARLIGERRQATVTEALERLHPTATMRPLKYVARVTVGIVVTPSAHYVQSGGVPALRSANVRPGRVVDDEVIQISTEGHGLHAKSALREGDVVVVRTGAGTGAAAVVPERYDGANCIDLVLIRPGRQLSPDYLQLVINADITRQHIARHSVGSGQAHFNVEAMKQIVIPMPPRAEQEAAVRAVQQQHALLDELREAVNDQLQLLEERRQALITTAVTGRMDVTGKAA